MPMYITAFRKHINLLCFSYRKLTVNDILNTNGITI